LTLPTYLGLGAMRSGTTWLAKLLGRHPQIYLPPRCKEVHFFDRHYDLGVDWYKGFFPAPREGAAYRQIGEITPKYLHDPRVPGRISKILPDCRFLVILRNPADRAYSHYSLLIRDRGVACGFEDQLQAMPEIVDRGFYAQQIKRYFGLFPPSRFCFLVFERAVQSPQVTCGALSEFLAVDFHEFDLNDQSLTTKVNRSLETRFMRVYLAGKAVARYLRSRGQGWVVDAAVRAGVRRLVRGSKPPPPMAREARQQLLSVYEADIRELESLIDEDLGFWLRDKKPGRAAA
jgi:hypothetical protein